MGFSDVLLFLDNETFGFKSVYNLAPYAHCGSYGGEIYEDSSGNTGICIETVKRRSM